jgi:hypothetical protein
MLGSSAGGGRSKVAFTSNALMSRAAVFAQDAVHQLLQRPRRLRQLQERFEQPLLAIDLKPSVR